MFRYVLADVFTNTPLKGKGLAVFTDARRRTGVWVDEAYRYVQVFTGDPLPDVNRRSVARADDVPAERLPHGRCSPPRAGWALHEQPGHHAT